MPMRSPRWTGRWPRPWKNGVKPAFPLKNSTNGGKRPHGNALRCWWTPGPGCLSTASTIPSSTRKGPPASSPGWARSRAGTPPLSRRTTRSWRGPGSAASGNTSFGPRTWQSSSTSPWSGYSTAAASNSRNRKRCTPGGAREAAPSSAMPSWRKRASRSSWACTAPTRRAAGITPSAPPSYSPMSGPTWPWAAAAS